MPTTVAELEAREKNVEDFVTQAKLAVTLAKWLCVTSLLSLLLVIGNIAWTFFDVRMTVNSLRENLASLKEKQAADYASFKEKQTADYANFLERHKAENDRVEKWMQAMVKHPVFNTLPLGPVQRGKLIAVDAETVTLQVVGKDAKFKLAADAGIRLDTQPAKLGDLKPLAGFIVTFQTIQGNDAMIGALLVISPEQ